MIKLIIKGKSFLVKILELMLIFSVGALVLDVVWGVFTRYVMGEQAKWTEELARFLLVWVSLLGGALAFGTKGHLGVDYFVGKLHCDARKLMTLISHFHRTAIFCLHLPLRRLLHCCRILKTRANDSGSGLENGLRLPGTTNLGLLHAFIHTGKPLRDHSYSCRSIA